MDEGENLTILGSKNIEYKFDLPKKEMLETFLNNYFDREYKISMVFPEFTSLCLSGDTLIDANEKHTHQGVPIRDLVGKEGFVFSFDTETRQPVTKR